MTDRRVNRTKRQIKKALINLLSKKALSRITVSEITELADIVGELFIRIIKISMTFIIH